MSALDEQATFYNPLQPGYVENPFPHLAEMREKDPVHHSLIERWMLFGYDDVFRLLRDPSLSVQDSNADLSQSERAAMFLELTEEAGQIPEPSYAILSIDPPDHTRLRRLVSKAFTPRTIENLRPMVEGLVDEVLDQMEADGDADVVSQLAFPLPFDVITKMLGMPETDTEQVCAWSEAIVKTLDPIITEDETRLAVEASANMDAYISSVIEWKRENPGDDLLTSMIEVEEDGDRMSLIELRDQVGLLFIAGHETTVNLIGTGIYELLRNPEQMARWIEDPSIGPSAVDELLRYVSPVQMTRRISMADIEFGDKTIDTGRFIMACLASANRDPARWGPTADQLDLTREGAGQHMSFGSGSHYCLGASLAKLEAEAAIGRFITRFPNTKVVEAEWNGRINLRGLSKLHVTV